MPSYVGSPSATDILAIMDGLSKEAALLWPYLGVGSPTETTTAYAKAIAARDAVMGDGSTVYGIGQSTLQQQLPYRLDQNIASITWQSFYASRFSSILSALDEEIRSGLPTGWSLFSATARTTDLWLLRLNACNANVPATPANTPTATATTGGALPTFVSGSCPRCKVTHVGASDWLESQPSAASSQVAMEGANNAFTIGNFPATVPTGVTKVRTYWQKIGAGSGDPYYYDTEYDVTAGSAFPTISRTSPDTSLNTSISPPSYASCLYLPIEAAIYAACSVPVLFGMSAITTVAMLNPANVTLGPVTGCLGIWNPASTGEFGRWVGGSGYAHSHPLLANDTTNNLQGFVGAAGGVQARVVSTLNGTAALTDVDYSYYDAAHPTSIQTATISGPLSLTATVGDTVDLGITSGRIVVSIDDMSVGTATTGTFLLEAKAHRSP